MFDFFETITLKVTFQALDNGELPELIGSTIRGIMGHCFRDFVCDYRDKKCFACQARSTCLYARYFCNTGGVGGAVNPYVIKPLTAGKTKWYRGDLCSFELSVFGTAAQDAGVYLDALQAMEKKGWGARRLPFRLLQVSDVNTGKLIYLIGKIWIRNLKPAVLEITERSAHEACLVFDVPVRIVSGDHLFTTLSFDLLIQFITRRFSLLAANFLPFYSKSPDKLLSALFLPFSLHAFL